MRARVVAGALLATVFVLAGDAQAPRTGAAGATGAFSPRIAAARLSRNGASGLTGHVKRCQPASQ